MQLSLTPQNGEHKEEKKMKMKKVLSIVLAAIMVVTLLAACGGTKAATKMTMGTGGTAGTYYAFGGVLGQYIQNKAGIEVNVVSTDGSKANIESIDSGDYQLGTVQSDVMAYAWAGSRSFESNGAINSFRVVGGLYAEAVQLITMDPNVKSVADLAGKSVSIGAPGSGTYFNAMDVLGAAGLTEADIKPQYQSFADSTDALKDGKIDAAFIVAGAPTTAITDLSTSGQVYLVSIDDEHVDKLIAASPYYSKYTVSADTYGMPEDAQTVAVAAMVLARNDVSEDAIYTFVSTIFDNADQLQHGKAAELSLEFASSISSVPYHPGAARYFAEKGFNVA